MYHNSSQYASKLSIGFNKIEFPKTQQFLWHDFRTINYIRHFSENERSSEDNLSHSSHYFLNETEGTSADH